MDKSKKNTKPNAAVQGSNEINHNRQLPRLSRIEGQVRGLQKMIETERAPLDIVHQISAVISALRRVQKDLLGDHLSMLGESIIAGSISQKRRREMADEVAALLKQLS